MPGMRKFGLKLVVSVGLLVGVLGKATSDGVTWGMPIGVAIGVAFMGGFTGISMGVTGGFAFSGNPYVFGGNTYGDSPADGSLLLAGPADGSSAGNIMGTGATGPPASVLSVGWV
jgi:hypothetical protein